MHKVLIAGAIVGSLAATPANAQFWGSSWGPAPFGMYGGYGMGPGAMMGMIGGMGLIGGLIGGAMAAQAAPPPMPVAAPMAPTPGAIVEDVVVPRPYRCNNSRGWDERYGWISRRVCR